MKKCRIFSADFETTVYEGQTDTEVWAAAIVELFTEDVSILHSIDELFHYILSLKSNVVCYFHNLKFDGSFWLDYLIRVLGLKQAFYWESEKHAKWLDDKDMASKSFKYSISAQGLWYSIKIKWGSYMIEIRDSLKLLPFSVKELGDTFGTKHKKMEMEYKGYRYAGCEITPKEQEYIRNDVLVVKEALEIMFEQGHEKLTIGSCCLTEFKRIIGREDYAKLFPQIENIELTERYKYQNAWEYVRKSYKGGWCYVVKGKKGKIFRRGNTLDVNSLYPSMMHSSSGNRYPIGKPMFWSGNFIPDKAKKDNMYYFVRIKTRFHVKDGYLPFIQVKGNALYKGTECLTTSDVYDVRTGKYYDSYIDFDGKEKKALLELTMTLSDYELFLEHYDVDYLEILDGCYFYAMVGIFDEYIDHYKKIKMESKGAIRTLAKLFLNNLYGKLATSLDSSFKLAVLKEDSSIGFIPVEEHEKKAGYIPCGSAITSYSRCFTIRAAQANYYGEDKRGFIYADTDSIHCDLEIEEIKGVVLHDSEFNCWKPESGWDEAVFARQKTYIEHVTHRNLKEIEKPYYDIKCAGMPERCKDLFKASMGVVELEGVTEREKEFMSVPRTLSDFKVGLRVPGKLRPKRIKGGVVLVDVDYEMRENYVRGW